MSWKKQSAEAALAGLTLREAALGALWDETMVKKMSDPLGQILDLSHVKKVHGLFQVYLQVRSESSEGFTYLRRSHASLTSQPVNRAVQYLRRLSQDPPSTQIRISHKQLEFVYACVLTVNYLLL